MCRSHVVIRLFILLVVACGCPRTWAESCSNTIGDMTINTQNIQALAVNGVHIFATQLSGLGYSLGFQCNGGAVHYIDGSSSPAGRHSATICDSDDLPALLTQKEIVIKAYVTFYKTGDVNLSGGNHTNVNAQPQVGKLFAAILGGKRYDQYIADLSGALGAERGYRCQRQLSGDHADHQREVGCGE